VLFIHSLGEAPEVLVKQRGKHSYSKAVDDSFGMVEMSTQFHERLNSSSTFSGGYPRCKFMVK